MTKIYIDCAVMTNNGDALLNLALHENLKRDHQVTIATPDSAFIAKAYPELDIQPIAYDTGLVGKALRKLGLDYLDGAVAFARAARRYLRNDHIVACPGGYINSNYGIITKLVPLYLAKKLLKRKVGIYSQSVGRLNSRDRRALWRLGRSLDYIYVRDQVSYDRIMSIDDFTNVTQTRDASFLYPAPAGRGSRSRTTVGVSVRPWPYDGASREAYFKVLDTLVRQALDTGHDVLFISSCQGVPGYTDDSVIAAEFVATMGYDSDPRVRIDSDFHSYPELRQITSNLAMLIGTRLHMCLTALQCGVPAFNISYEEKGTAAYEYLGISRYTVGYNESSDITEQAREFFAGEHDWNETWERIEAFRREEFVHFDAAFPQAEMDRPDNGRVNSV